METRRMKKYKFVTGEQYGGDVNVNVSGNVSGKASELTLPEVKSIYESIGADKSTTYSISKRDTLVDTTYGEITYEGISAMIGEVKLADSDVFYDLGSGNGKAVMQIFTNARVKEAHGIEFHPDRFKTSQHALKKLYKIKPELLDENRIICYRLENIKDMSYLDTATVIYMCSTCYPSELLDIVYDKIKGSKNIRCVVTHKECQKFKEVLPRERKAVFPCTWDSKISWYIYEK
jgi:hypothetical protein